MAGVPQLPCGPPSGRPMPQHRGSQNPRGAAETNEGRNGLIRFRCCAAGVCRIGATSTWGAPHTHKRAARSRTTLEAQSAKLIQAGPLRTFTRPCLWREEDRRAARPARESTTCGGTQGNRMWGGLQRFVVCPSGHIFQSTEDNALRRHCDTTTAPAKSIPILFLVARASCPCSSSSTHITG